MATLFFTVTAVAQAQQRKPTGPVAAPPSFDAADVESRFFVDAREQLQGSRPQYGAGVVKAGRPNQPGTATTGSAPSGPGDGSGGFAWSQLISRETIEDEIKSLKMKVEQTISLPAPFKSGGNRDAQKQFSMLAVLFGIAGEYDQDVRWKENSPGLREMFARAGFNCKVGTDQSFNEAKARKQDLVDLIAGSQLPVDSAERKATWDKVAFRPILMRWLEDSFEKRLAPWLSNKSEFAKNQDAIRREAELIAAVAEVIQRENYEF
ncbi:MAG: hypothetical protein KDA42_19960, partial [Planctomycetales bacterium]|nr:hypothetical protein [Planctomycetales bacterium]